MTSPFFTFDRRLDKTISREIETTALLDGSLLNEKYPRCDSNAQPTAPQAVALSIKLRGHKSE